MAIEKVGPLDLKIAQLLGNEEISAPPSPEKIAARPNIGTSPFEDILGRAVDALNGVSKVETRANQMIDQYVRGEADLQDVMVQTSKMNIMVQMATTTINLAVNTFKEITQMQI